MNKILQLEDATSIAQKTHEQGKSIVLVGGCFDILHIGHITFLAKSKQVGDTLMVLLESDDAVRKFKGEARPVNAQQDRANILAALSLVDYIVLLPKVFDDKDYDNLMQQIHPEILATTKGDSLRMHKERQARLIGAKVIDVTGRISKHSTSRLAKLLAQEYCL